MLKRNVKFVTFLSNFLQEVEIIHCSHKSSELTRLVNRFKFLNKSVISYG